MKFIKLHKVRVIVLLAVGCAVLAVSNGDAIIENIGCSARAVGMGNVFTGLADNVFSVYYNPAGLGQMMRTEAAVSYATFFQGLTDKSAIALNYYGFAVPMRTLKSDYGSVGIGYYTFDVTNLYQESIFMFGFGKDMGPIINIPVSLGITAKNITIKYGQDEYTESNPVFTSGYAKTQTTVDIGGLYNISKEIMFGFNILNITQPDMGLYSANKLPMQIKAGVGYRLADSSFGIDLLYATAVSINLGVEKWFAKNTVGIRGGVGLGSQDYKVFNLGASYYFPRMDLGRLALDYGWHYPLSGLKETMGTHWVTLRVLFGRELKQIKRIQVQASPDSAYISPIVPEAKNRVVFTLTSSAAEVESWEFVIKKSDESGTSIRTYRGTGKVAPSLEWDGRDETSQVVPDGKYPYNLKVVDTIGNKSETLDQQVVVDSKPPKCELTPGTTVFSPNGDLKDDILFVNLMAKDDNAVDHWMIQIVDSKNNLAKTIKGELDPPGKIEWDGRDDYYQQIVRSGTYTIKMVVWDIAGNKAEAEDKFVNVDIPVQVREVIQVKEIIKEIIREVPKDITIKQEKDGLKVTMASSILFDAGKYTLRTQAYDALNQIVKILDAYPENGVRIEGHTDSVGSDSYNQVLSEMRARSVFDYLSKHGVEITRLKAVGRGSKSPMAPNTTNEGRVLNRRVEIVIIGAQE
ncbi:MAG: OmpA family protein [Elusimicrobiota bacterium]